MLYKAILRCCRYASHMQSAEAENVFIQNLQRALGNNLRACQDAFIAMMSLDEASVSRQQFAAAVTWLNAYENAKSAALRDLRCPIEAYFDVQALPAAR